MKKATKKGKRSQIAQKSDRWPTITKIDRYANILNYNNVLVSLLFFIQMIWTLPQPANMQGSGLDSSWVNALYTMVIDHMRFGQDIIFTYGPLGFLTGPMLIDYNLWRLSFLFQIFIHILLYLSVYVLLKKLSAKWYHYLLMLPVLFFANTGTDELLPILTSIMLFICLMKPEEEGLDRRNYNYIWLTLSGFLIAVSSLLKFNSLVVGLSILTISVILFILLKKDYKSSLYLISCSVLLFIAFWLAFGQNFDSLPGYMQYGMELTQGYSSAMSLVGGFSQGGQMRILFGLIGSIICVICLLVYSLIEKRNNILIFLIMNLFLLFSSYKHGFVRLDLHIIVFSQMFILVLGILFILILVEMQKRQSYLGIFCSAITLIVLLTLISMTYLLAPGILNANILTESGSYKLTGQMLLDQSVFNSMVADEKKSVQSDYAIDNQTLRYIDNKSVDIVPWDIALGWAYDLNWSPRFVIQSYLDYTADLDNLTSLHFIDKDPPQIVLYSYKSIDERYPLYDEPSTFRAILDHYNYSRTSGEFLVLNRSGDQENFVKTIDLGATSGNIGEEVPGHPELVSANTQEIMVPSYNGLVFGSVRVNYNVYGKIMDTLYKPSNLYIRFKLRNGSITGPGRLIPDDASNGLLLSHFVGNQGDLIGLFQGDLSNDVEGIYLVSDDPGQYASDVRVSFVGYSKQ